MVLDAAGRLTVDCSRTVVVVVGVGVSTTVVQDVRTVAATMRAGRRMMSFFIFCWMVPPSLRGYSAR